MKKKNVVLIRGVLDRSKNFDMLKKKLEAYFVFYDYKPKYASFTIKQISDDLKEFIRSNDLKNYDFITHSMGGIIARYFLATNKIKKKKVVMIAVPNNGSFLLESTIKKVPLASKILGKAPLEFTQNKNQILKHPKKCQYCVILGTKSFEWRRIESYISPLLWDSNESDGKVKIKEGKYKKEKFYLVDGYHSFIAEHPDTIKIIKEFLV